VCGMRSSEGWGSSSIWGSKSSVDLSLIAGEGLRPESSSGCEFFRGGKLFIPVGMPKNLNSSVKVKGDGTPPTPMFLPRVRNRLKRKELSFTWVQKSA
jgi:hypothetical protein